MTERKYVGVSFEPRTRRYAATLYRDGRSHVLGRWPTARQGAIARDRAILHFGDDRPLQVPRASRRLGAASPDELRHEAVLKVVNNTASGMFGVSPYGSAWSANVSWQRRQIFVGQFESKEEAGIAHDRVARYLCPGTTRVNYPDRDIVPTSIEDMRREATAEKKARTTSRYRGVTYEAQREFKNWAAAITVDYVCVGLGRWETERDAAIAYDRAALHYVGADAVLNFPRASRAAGPADVETLLAEARAELKQRTSSKFRGVVWNKNARKWMASISHVRKQRYLGLFDDEVAAAEAYDHEAVKLLGDAARVNFHPGTGEFLGGRILGDLRGQRPKRAKTIAPATTRSATRKRTK